MTVELTELNSAAPPLTVAAYPGVRDRLLAGTVGTESLNDYLAAGGYRVLSDPDGLLAQTERLDLRGRGGGAFPLHRKVTGVRQEVNRGTGPAVVVANGEEGEPTSVKDRWLLRNRPHLVLDGLRLAAALAGADELHVYLSDPDAAVAVEHALADLAAAVTPAGSSAAGGAALVAAGRPAVRITRVAPAYVAGEETAVVRAIDGGPALPTDKPPRPYQEGVGGRPTLISNVETLAHLALIHRMGADTYGAVGTAGSPGTLLVTVTGQAKPGLYEVPFGLTIRDLMHWRDDDPEGVTGVLMGGYFTGIAAREVLDVPMDYAGMRAVGAGLGCGAIAVLGETDCPVVVTAVVMAYFARENAGQCGSCFNGTAAMSAVLSALAAGRADEANIDRLSHWSGFLPGRGACGTLDGATNVARSLLTTFPQAVQAHLTGDCLVCGPDGSVAVDPDVAAPYAAAP